MVAPVQFSMRSFIRAVKTGERQVSRAEMQAFVRGVIEPKPERAIPKEQIGAWLAYVRQNGLSDRETTYLTESMAAEGRTLDLSEVEGTTVDKHSSGGVSDGTSLVLAPLAACFGLKVPMMSGRGLGHTGGTLDKLEAIPGFRIGLPEAEVVSLLNNVGLAMFGQTPDIAPADRILYATRDVTETVDSIPLIAASIMSKKLAENTGALVLNVTTGSGAFMSSFADAEKLAKTMVAIAQGAGRKASAVITSMDQPLGPMVGNALEIRQTLRVLNGERAGFENFIAVIEELAAHMLVHGGLFTHQNMNTAKNRARNAVRAKLATREPLEKFRDMIIAQGGNVHVVDDPSLLPTATRKLPIPAPKEGYVQAIDTTKVGLAAVALGAGRERVEDIIDPAVGIEVHAFVGDEVGKGKPLGIFHLNHLTRLTDGGASKLFAGAYTIGPNPPKTKPRLIQRTIW